LLRTILGSAVHDRRLAPTHATFGAPANVNRARHIEPATLTQLETLVSAMPQRYQPMVLLASWCALRFGELIELRRWDIDLSNGVVKVRRGAVRAEGTVVIGDPKSDAGRRDVAVPPHLMPLLREHLSQSIVGGGRDGLLFPAADGTSTLAPSTFYRSYYRARDAAGRPDLRFHDLRHTGAVLAAQTGATLAELMGRLGHSTPAAALRYQHAARGRDAEIAMALSKIAEATR
jgi:integrase